MNMILDSSAFWMTLNNSGYRMFELISRGLSEEKIIEEMAAFYEIPREYIQRDFLEFKREMMEKLHTCEEIEKKEKENYSTDPYCEQGKKRLELWQSVSLRIRPAKEA